MRSRSAGSRRGPHFRSSASEAPERPARSALAAASTTAVWPVSLAAVSLRSSDPWRKTTTGRSPSSSVTIRTYCSGMAQRRRIVEAETRLFEVELHHGLAKQAGPGDGVGTRRNLLGDLREERRPRRVADLERRARRDRPAEDVRDEAQRELRGQGRRDSDRPVRSSVDGEPDGSAQHGRVDEERAVPADQGQACRRLSEHRAAPADLRRRHRAGGQPGPRDFAFDRARRVGDVAIAGRGAEVEIEARRADAHEAAVAPREGEGQGISSDDVEADGGGIRVGGAEAEERLLLVREQPGPAPEI